MPINATSKSSEYLVHCYDDEHAPYYRGFENVTGKGKPCLRWDSELPEHEKLENLSIDREEFLKHAENYCRIPRSTMTRPICYFNNSENPHSSQWDYCNVPKCSGMQHFRFTRGSFESFSETGVDFGLFGVLGVWLCVVVFAVILTVVCLRNKNTVQRCFPAAWPHCCFFRWRSNSVSTTKTWNVTNYTPVSCSGSSVDDDDENSQPVDESANGVCRHHSGCCEVACPEMRGEHRDRVPSIASKSSCSQSSSSRGSGGTRLGVVNEKAEEKMRESFKRAKEEEVKQLLKSAFPAVQSPAVSPRLSVGELSVNELYFGYTCEHLRQLERFEFPRNNLVGDTLLGRGAFATVYLSKATAATGMLHDHPDGKSCCQAASSAASWSWTCIGTEVAVKVEKNNDANDLRNMKGFEREATMIIELDHPNVIRLLGVCFRSPPRPRCLIVEYMPYGDLKRFLRACSPVNRENLVVEDAPDGMRSTKMKKRIVYDRSSLTALEQLSLVEQVATGMQYLASQRCVHGDLATRNCLVGEALAVKIADFGMSFHLPEGATSHQLKTEEYFPVRWMPPEALSARIFSIESDVWAFGVLVWEVYSYALVPYYGRSNSQVEACVQAGGVLERAPFASDGIDALSRACWAFAREARPSFERVLALLRDERERIMLQGEKAVAKLLESSESAI